MLRLVAAQAETLWDEALPIEMRELPEDPAALDELLCDPGLVAPFVACWQREALESGVSAADHGRPTIAIETYVRLMVLKQRHGWGYRGLVAEVSDSIHLRRFCRIALTERVPDESTVRKLTRRIGAETVNDMTRELISAAVRRAPFPGTRDQDRLDGDRGRHQVPDRRRAGGARREVARARGPQARRQALRDKVRVRDRSRAMGRRLRSISRTIRRRTGEAKAEVLALTEQTGELLKQSIKEARRLAATARRKARGRGAQAKLRVARALDELADRCAKVATQITQRVRGEKISDRLISLADPDARPIRKGKLGKPTEFGYVAQIAEITPNTRRGARGLIVPAASLPGNPGENTLLPQTIAELDRLGLTPREVALDGGFTLAATNDAVSDLPPERVFIAGRQQPGSRRTQRRLQRYRTGAEGRISHLKRGYGLRRSRLKGDDGQKTWTGWSILAYNHDTLTIRTA